MTMPSPVPPIHPTDGDQIVALERSLTNVTPSQEQLDRILIIRALGKELGKAVILNAPNGRERSFALTHLEETVMWAVKAIVLE